MGRYSRSGVPPHFDYRVKLWESALLVEAALFLTALLAAEVAAEAAALLVAATLAAFAALVVATEATLLGCWPPRSLSPPPNPPDSWPLDCWPPSLRSSPPPKPPPCSDCWPPPRCRCRRRSCPGRRPARTAGRRPAAVPGRHRSRHPAAPGRRRRRSSRCPVQSFPTCFTPWLMTYGRVLLFGCQSSTSTVLIQGNARKIA